MKSKSLAAFLILVVTGCATPVVREASMDWSAFIHSVPGTFTGDFGYETPTLKLSAHRANTPELERTKASFANWCMAHGGKLPNVPHFQSTGIAKSFSSAAMSWKNREIALYGKDFDSTIQFCFDKESQLTAIMMIRTYNGYRSFPSDPKKLPAPTIAFYTPEQAAQFVEYNKQKEKERGEAARKESQQRSEMQAKETRRLRNAPNIGDQTMVGTIIDLRPPLALIQYNAEMRIMLNKPQSEWIPISSLESPTMN